LQALVAAQQRRYDLASARDQRGVSSYLNVITAQQDLFSAQQNLIEHATILWPPASNFIKPSEEVGNEIAHLHFVVTRHPVSLQAAGRRRGTL
jgi:hypothetical protein